MRLLSAALVLIFLTGCDSGRLYLQPEPGRGDAARGKELILLHECWDCHLIPGIDRKPGPGIPTSLEGLARREALIGDVENTRENLEAYLLYPKKVYPPTRMPGLGGREDAARDIAAYLVTLD